MAWIICSASSLQGAPTTNFEADIVFFSDHLGPPLPKNLVSQHSPLNSASNLVVTYIVNILTIDSWHTDTLSLCIIIGQRRPRGWGVGGGEWGDER